jgi:integrase/recombinase XerD
VRALHSAAQSPGSPSQHMLALATYMGHVNISDTYWYLEATPELLRDIAAACEAFYERKPS